MRLKKVSAGMLTAVLVMIGMWAWTSRTVSAHQPPIAGTGGHWHHQLHAELMSMLPQSVRERIQKWHGGQTAR
jgi:hypothetical protein